jgi:mycothiol synthase
MPDHVEDDFTAPFVDLELDTRGYWLDDRLVAYGLIWHRPSGEREERAHLQGVVDPDWRGQGIGRHLLAWELERAKESLAARDRSLPWFIRTDEWDWIEDAHHLYRRLGMTPVRYMKEMIRVLDHQVPVDVPHGIEIVLWDRDRDEDARRTVNDSFADHWGSTPTDAESYKHRLDSAGTRLDLSFLALADGEVVGICTNSVYPEDEAVTGRREGWVMTLGVQREWRGKGLASALLRASFNAFLDAGLSHSMIAVDAENPSGAFRLYEKLGYEVLHGSITSQIQVNHP